MLHGGCVCRLAVAGVASHVPKPPEVTKAIVEALQKNFVFKGIPEDVLIEVRMFCFCPLARLQFKDVLTAGPYR